MLKGGDSSMRLNNVIKKKANQYYNNDAKQVIADTINGYNKQYSYKEYSIAFNKEHGKPFDEFMFELYKLYDGIDGTCKFNSNEGAFINKYKRLFDNPIIIKIMNTILKSNDYNPQYKPAEFRKFLNDCQSGGARTRRQKRARGSRRR